MPVFLHRIISGDDIEERNKFALWRDSLQPGGDFVDSYLLLLRCHHRPEPYL